MKFGTLRNPKFLRLARRLGCGKAAAAGHLEALWHFATEQAPAGDVGRWLDDDIAEGCFWEGEPAEFVGALIDAGWLDRCAQHRLVVHDWADHASEMLRKRNARAGITFVSSSPVGQPSDARPPDGGHPADTRQPSGSRPADHPTPPHLTSPHQTNTLVDDDEGRAPDPVCELVLIPTEPGDIEAEVFAEVRSAMTGYVEALSGSGVPDRLTLSKARRARMRAIAKEYGPDACLEAIHGYAHRCLAPGRWAERWRHFNPDSIWAASNVAQNIEADRQARAAGHTRPYGLASEPSEPGWLAQTRRIAARGAQR